MAAETFKGVVEVIEGYQGKVVLEMTNPTKTEVTRVIQKIDWDTFHIVSLYHTKHHYINISGSRRKDGYACSLTKLGKTYLLATPPQSVSQMVAIVEAYYTDVNSVDQQYDFEFLQVDLREKQQEQLAYERWKQQYEQQKKKDKKGYVKKLILFLCAFTMVGCIAYAWVTNELQFALQETSYTTGVVVATSMHHVGRGYYMQTVTYEFQYNGKTYQNTFEAGKLTGRQAEGDFLKIKFAVNHPERSKMEYNLDHRYH